MVELEFQPDFHKIMQRYEAWWHCELIDRPIVAISVKPKRETPIPPKTHAGIREKWFDIEYGLELAAAQIANACSYTARISRMHSLSQRDFVPRGHCFA